MLSVALLLAVALVPATLAQATPLLEKSPIVIDSCDANFENPRNREYVAVGISFHNASATTATTVRFEIQLTDKDELVLQRESEAIAGKFASGTRVVPKRGALSKLYVFQSAVASSPAWEIRNAHGFDVAHIRCMIESATFA